MTTSYNTRTIPTTSYSPRPSIAKVNTIAPIVTGIWNDVATWLETGKLWNDAGDGSGTTYTTRIIP